MKCPRCHKEFNASGNYCSFCGYEGKPKGQKAGRFQFKREEKKQSLPESKKGELSLLRSFDPASLARKSHSLSNLQLGQTANKQIQDVKPISETGESALLSRFKSRHRIEDMFKPYEGKIKIEDQDEGSCILLMTNRTHLVFWIRIEGVGNPYYEDFRMKPFQKRKAFLQKGTYNTHSFLEKSGIRWLKPMTKKERWHYTRSPIDSDYNSISRTFTLENGVYMYWCRSNNPLRNIGLRLFGRQ